MTEEMAGAEVKEQPKQVEPPTPLTFEDVEASLRMAIREAANEVVSASDSAPEDFRGDNAELAASCGNVATVWTNIAVGLIAGLERLRLSHDQVKGGTLQQPNLTGDIVGEGVSEKLLSDVLAAAERGESPIRIAQLIQSRMGVGNGS